MADQPENMPEETTPESGAAEAASTDESQAAPSGGKSASVALEHGRAGILGVKSGMTQVYTDSGSALAVTVIDLQPNVITQVKNKESDGYQAVQVGFLNKGTKHTNKAEAGHAKKSGNTGFYHYQEFRIPEGGKMDGLEMGVQLSAEFVKDGDLVDLTAVSKGKGFQGTMKRHHFSGGPKSHGASKVHRAGGSLGMRADPGKVYKGRKMAGHMGHQRKTVQNVRVVKVDTENQIMLVHGSVPGPKSGIVTIRRAVKQMTGPQNS